MFTRFVSGLFLLIALPLAAQQPPVVKIDQLEKRFRNNSDTTYVLNFWATWCAPCVAELPYFERADSLHAKDKVKVLLVSMDFIEDYESKLLPFVQKRQLRSEVMLLDETKADYFMPKIDEKWEGALPGTLILNNKTGFRKFIQAKLKDHEELEQWIKTSAAAGPGKTESLIGEELALVIEKRGGRKDVLPVVDIYIENRSKTNRYKVIESGDGSETGWREPFLYFTGEFRGTNDSNWIPLERHIALRCGIYDPVWTDDTLLLMPGQKAKQMYYGNPFAGFHNMGTGTLRLTAHYEYAPGTERRAKMPPEAIEKLGIPPFTLLSNTLEIPVTGKEGRE